MPSIRTITRIIPLAAVSAMVWCVLAPSVATAQARVPPSCGENVDSLAHRIEVNYAGAKLEIVGERRAEYGRMLDSLRAVAAATPDDGCYPVLARLTDWFEDPHLFVFQSARIDTAEAARRAGSLRRVELDEAQARAYFERRAGTLDPIEGIWYDGKLRVAVVPDSTGAAGRFVAVVLTPDTAAWPAGVVRARFARRPDGSYDVELWGRNFSTRRLHGRVHKRVLLRTSPGMWGKEYPVLTADRGLLDPIDPHRATLLVRGGAVVISIPSHDPTYRGTLDTLLATHAEALRGAERLIVDLRGNEGGSSWMTNGLLPYMATERKRATPFDTGRAVMLSSPDQIAYARRAFGPDTSAFVRSLVERLRANPGALVPLRDPSTPEPAARRDSVVYGPRRVGVLVDRGTVSAAEVLALDALRSERTRVYGEPTAGALDYQSTSIVPITAAERRWYLGYPTIAARASLPAGGMRGKGIAPDVRVDWSRIADPIGYVEQMLARW